MNKKGNLHPITSYFREALKIFEELGFEVYASPEVDTEWYNFDAVNVPSDHPSRDVQDTFWLTDKRVLRTHTSNGQVRAGKEKELPVRVVIPGRCFRNESTDAQHETTFYQLECLYIDKGVNIGNLFWMLENFIKKMFGDEIKIRRRPHHYSFVEPGFDIDIWFQGGWLEVLGSGMVHPKVLKNMGIDSRVYSGFAFGIGIDRMVMLKYGISDIRQFYGGDLRFLKQF